jgi:predicted glycogen debranching enzyme
MIRWHRQGTRHGIAEDPADGLLRAGEPSVQLTWMDARVGERVVTPRTGKAVEVNALRYNALRVMAAFASRVGRESEKWAGLADRVRTAYGVGSLGEIFDGDAPHAPRGTIAQAWTVAETLRAWTALAP